VRLAENTMKRSYWDLRFPGYDCGIDCLFNSADEFDVAALLAGLHETNGFETALDLSEG